MKTQKDIIRECVFGYDPNHTASEYRIAMATITAACGPRGHKKRCEFSAIVDLDCNPMVNDAGMIVQVMTSRSSRFKKLPVVFVDFTHWTDSHGNRHEFDHADSFVFEKFARNVILTKRELIELAGYSKSSQMYGYELTEDEYDESDAFDATGLDNETTETIIRSRLSILVDESDDDIWEQCRLESEALEEEESYVKAMAEELDFVM